MPSPFVSVVHWVSQDNYRRRLAGQTQPDAQSQWQRGCERHLNLLYLVAPMPDEKLQLKLNAAETDGIQWFSLAELETLDTDDGIKKEVRLAFQLEKDYDKYYPQSN